MANLKRNMIELVSNPQEVAEGGKPEIKKYWTPAFIPFTKVREAMQLAAELEDNDTSNYSESVDKLADFVASVYGEQFTKDDLYNGLHAPDAISALQEQIFFIAQGQQSDSTKKIPGEEKLNDEDFSFAKQSEYLDKLVRDLVKEGMPISEVMNMPYNYMIDIMVERQEEHHSNSFFDLLG